MVTPGPLPKIFIFTGPTLSAEEAGRVLDAVILPPVCQGDIYTAVREGPSAIGIIDGYFERVPAVWHKEILWAMSEGVHVFGSASMGALRAAELCDFGMVGVGAVFESFLNGDLEDDDEVALVHGSSETGYLQGSEAMVNIRATLQAAGELISDSTRRALVILAKSLYYPKRTYDAILTLGREEGLPDRELEALSSWLPAGRQNLKKSDALKMLHVMKEWAETGPSAKQVDYVFQHTDAWEQVRRHIDRRPLNTQAGADTFQPDALLDELRLQGEPYRTCRLQALVRTLALELARYERLTVDPQLLRATADNFRLEQNLLLPEEVAAWLDQQQLNPDEFARLLRDEARLRYVQTLSEGDVTRHMPDVLRINGQYHRLVERALLKERLLASRNLGIPSLSAAGITEEELWRWYFEERLKTKIPADIALYSQEFHFFSLDAFRQTVLREFCFLKLSSDL